MEIKEESTYVSLTVINLILLTELVQIKQFNGLKFVTNIAYIKNLNFESKAKTLIPLFDSFGGRRKKKILDCQRH